MPDVVAPPSANLTTAPAASTLDALKGKHIREICGNGYVDDNDNHCAHFVSHVMGFTFGATCRMMSSGTAAGACIRVHELFAMCPEVGAWDTRTATSCLAFVTDRSNVDLRRRRMSNVPRKHVGIYLSGTIWHYSNAQTKVVTQVPDEFAHHYPGAGIALFWGTFPR
jgi:hypothetical protein